ADPAPFCRLLVRPVRCRFSPSPPDGPAGESLCSEGGHLFVIMRLRRSMDTSRRPPSGWAQCAPGARRPRVTSSLLEPRPQCQRYDEAAGLLREVVAFAPHCEDALR